MSGLNSGIRVLFYTSGLSKYLGQPVIATQLRNYAARKGTRERKKKQKVKVEEKKVGFIPHKERDKEKLLLTRRKCKFDDSWKQLPKDNVYPHRYYQWPTYSFVEAVQCHKETHHPDVYNLPHAYLHVSIELNMEGEKKTRLVDNFTRNAPVAHSFDTGEQRNVLAFTNIPEMQEEIRQAGAQLVGGTELIKEIQNGAIPLQDFQYIIAHPNILAELVVLKGLMKRNFPNIKQGTLDVDVPAVCKRLLHGIIYTAKKDEYETDFGLIETVIGKLDMETEHLEENFSLLIKDIYKVKPKREGAFVTRCLLWSPPSSEKLRVDHRQYLDLAEEEKDQKDDSDEKQAVAT